MWAHCEVPSHVEGKSDDVPHGKWADVAAQVSQWIRSGVVFSRGGVPLTTPESVARYAIDVMEGQRALCGVLTMFDAAR